MQRRDSPTAVATAVAQMQREQLDTYVMNNANSRSASDSSANGEDETSATAAPVGVQRNQLLLIAQRNLLACKKCWICLNSLDLNDKECLVIQKYINMKNLLYLNLNMQAYMNNNNNNNNNNSNNRALREECTSANTVSLPPAHNSTAVTAGRDIQSDGNYDLIMLKTLMNKYVLSACKCRKKLAHKTCFNNYIDLKQNGNINMKIFCSQCNYKYEFDYPYNSKLVNRQKKRFLFFLFSNIFLK
jgi:hypothetical protein